MRAAAPIAAFALLALLHATGPGAPARAQGLDRVLQSLLVVETELLDDALERYREARRREGEAVQRLQRLAGELDEALGDPDTPLAELHRREGEVAEARAVAAARMEETGALRRLAYARMARIEELGAQLDRERDRELARTSALEGRWRLELGAFELGRDEIEGVMDLRLDGTLVTGTYRLSNGARGSLSGTLASGRVELQRIDAGGGFVAVLRGRLEAERGVLTGSWESVDVSGGHPSGGEWAARKVEAGDGDEG